jgi:hypothetical protein
MSKKQTYGEFPGVKVETGSAWISSATDLGPIDVHLDDVSSEHAREETKTVRVYIWGDEVDENPERAQELANVTSYLSQQYVIAQPVVLPDSLREHEDDDNFSDLVTRQIVARLYGTNPGGQASR